MILRTSDEHFANLPDFPYAPHYIEGLPSFKDLRLHYLDEGPPTARVFLCLHGQPTWSYLYRRMIPIFSAAGHRSVAPDLFGFGRSDKPAEDERYTFAFHRQSLIELIERLDLRQITLVCQDWGGLLGLTLPMEMAERFEAMLIMNTALGTGDVALSEGFLAWRAWAKQHPDMDIAKLLSRACPHLTEAECQAYAAPYPDTRYKAGVRRFPELVPDRPDADGAEISQRARLWLRDDWQGQSFMAVGMRDPVLGAGPMASLRRDIRGCPAPLELAEAGHFVPEWGESVARQALAASSLANDPR